jgi:hypothetical protein
MVDWPWERKEPRSGLDGQRERNGWVGNERARRRHRSACKGQHADRTILIIFGLLQVS